MSNTNKLVIIVAIILIIVCLWVGNNKTQDVDIINQDSQQVKEVAYNTVMNETTGEEEYVVYDKDTGREITRVEDEHQLKIYEIDPNYEELPVESQEGQNEEIITE